MSCLKEFVNKSNLNWHTKTFHRPYVQNPVDKFDVPRQSGVLYLYGAGPSCDYLSDQFGKVDDSQLRADRCVASYEKTRWW